MNVDMWKRRSATSLGLVPSPATYHDASPVPSPTEAKSPRVLTRALRSLSSSSMDSITASSTRSSSSSRRLHKTPSSNSSMMDRLQKRVSRDSPASESPGSPLDQLQPYSSMEVMQCGPLKADISLLKARSEYLVLSDQVLVKFTSGDAARIAFPQLNRTDPHAHDAVPCSPVSGKMSPTDVRLEIPLRSVVAAFNDDSISNRSGIEVWWFSPWPKLAYSKAHFYFSLPKERDVWLASIHRACRTKWRKTPTSSLIPDNLRSRANHIVRAAEGQAEAGHQSVIFPVARRVFGGGSGHKNAGAEDAPEKSDISSFFLIIGPCMCHFVEVLKAHHATAPGDLRVKALSYGTVTLTRLKASVASHEHRFVMCFRSPFGREARVDLASAQYRRIIETLTKADRILKPMWPQHFQQVIFDVKGLPPPLQLTSGNDLGGLKRSLEAYCAAYQVHVPNWTIDWSPPPQPAFRLLPPTGHSYSPMQLLAVFRALRYNSFFKAVSFRGIDLSPLVGRSDKTQYGDSLAYKSLNGVTISEDHHESLLHAPILVQEVHALLFTSESIRSLDMSNVLGLEMKSNRLSRLQRDISSMYKTTSEILRPFLELLKRQLCVCHSMSLSGNPISPTDLDELATVLDLDQVHLRRLDLSNCSLGDAGLAKLWVSLAGQADSLEWIDSSNNQGCARFEVIQSTLSGMKRLSKLKIAGNTRILSEESLFDEAVMCAWELEELDLSGIMLNTSTVSTLSNYLEGNNSRKLQVLRLNNCGLTGTQLAQLFYAMGKARTMELHINASRMDEGIDELCEAIAKGYGPWCLFAQMIEFAREANYIKLLQAFTANTSIECLNLAGTSTPDAITATACQAIAEFFVKNRTVRFLDISGYDSKLDEGRLGREFSKALLGLRTNESIEHLRVRSQMLNINIGDLAEAISENKTLHTLDCEGNDFNLSNYRHLATSLEQNSTIRYFSAFSAGDLNRAICKSLETAGTAALPARRSSVMSRFKPDKTPVATGRPLIQRLREEWEAAGADLARILQRNQKMFDLANASEPEPSSAQTSHRNSLTELAFSTVFGGLPLKDFECKRAKARRCSQESQQAPSGDLASRRHSHHGSIGSLKLAIRPVSVVSSETGVSPSTEDASSGSGDIPTPPEAESPIEDHLALANEKGIEVLFNTASLFSEQPEESNYAYSDGQDVDDGVQMKRYRRYLGDPTSRIDEEDGANDTASS